VRENGRLRLPAEIKPLRLFGQEINPTTFAMARMNAVIHNLEADIRIGDTMRQPAFKNDAGQLQTFDAVWPTHVESVFRIRKGTLHAK